MSSPYPEFVMLEVPLGALGITASGCALSPIILLPGLGKDNGVSPGLEVCTLYSLLLSGYALGLGGKGCPVVAVRTPVAERILVLERGVACWMGLWSLAAG